MPAQPSTSAWVADRPLKKGPENYMGLRDDYKDFILGNELLPLPSIMEAVAARTIFLLMADVKLRKFMAVSREVMEEDLKALNIEAKVLARKSNAM